LATAVFVSFLFFAWAQSRTLTKQYEVLKAELAQVSKQALDEETTDPERVAQLLSDLASAREKDPQPSMDAFDVMVKFSEAVPEDIVHDVEELDVQRGHVKVYGLVNQAEDAETIAGALLEVECFEGAKVSKIAQKVSSDRQKYTLEFEVKCPEDKAKAKPGAAPAKPEKPEAEQEKAPEESP
jgi:general secretion pathway protein L